MAEWDPNKLLTKPNTGPTGSPPPDSQSDWQQDLPWNRALNKSDPVVPGVNASSVDARPEEQPVVNAQSGAQQTGEKNPPPPPPREPSEEQRYNSAARTADTTVAMYNPRGLGNQSQYKQSQGNVVPGSLQAKVEAEKAIGKRDPWTGWNDQRRETRPVLHSMKGADGTTYYQQVDGKAGTARYWSVDSSGNRTEYTGDDKVSARDQINAARKNADLEAKKNYWRSRGVQFGETDEKGNFTGKFEKLTAEGARAEYERKFGKAEREIQDLRNSAESGKWHEQVTGNQRDHAEAMADADRMEDELDKQRLAWSQSGEGRETYNWRDKSQQVHEDGSAYRKVDWNNAAGPSSSGASSSMTAAERQRRWNANNLRPDGTRRTDSAPTLQEQRTAERKARAERPGLSGDDLEAVRGARKAQNAENLRLTEGYRTEYDPNSQETRDRIRGRMRRWTGNV